MTYLTVKPAFCESRVPQQIRNNAQTEQLFVFLDFISNKIKIHNIA